MVLVGDTVSAIQSLDGSWRKTNWRILDIDEEVDGALFGGEEAGLRVGSLFRSKNNPWAKVQRVVTVKSFDDLEVDDIIVDHTLGIGWASQSYNTAWQLDIKRTNTTWKMTKLDSNLPSALSKFTGYKYKTIPSQGGRTGSAVQAAVAIKDDRWNGICPRCGKGTYQGFNVIVDHDGPCQGSKK
jgi:hypothetical protein